MRERNKLFVIIILPFVSLMNLYAQDTRGQPLSVFAQDGTTVVAQFGGAYALVIGESEYKHLIQLPPVKDDVIAVTKLFEELGFHVEKLENKTYTELFSGIKKFLDNYGMHDDTRLLIYYAGHGETLKLNTGDMGFIVPIDAPSLTKGNRSSETAFREKAISMEQFNLWAKEYDCRHILFIFDSCFSGSVFGHRGTTASTEIIKDAVGMVRQFITAGNAEQTVPRLSVFRPLLERAFRNGQADFNKDGYITGTELGMYLRGEVMNRYSGKWTPEYGKSLLPKLDEGDFIFKVSDQSPSSGSILPPTAFMGNISVTSAIAGEIIIDSKPTGTKIKAGGVEIIANIKTGETIISLKGDDGKTTEPYTVMVLQGRTVSVNIKRPVPDTFVRLNGTFIMGSPLNETNREIDETPHTVIVNTFYMGKNPVTQKEYEEIMGTNPSYFRGSNLPVEMVSWYDAVEYCNKLSQKEGLDLAYTIENRPDPNNKNKDDKVTVRWNRNANGYRLPTEAEWEYACRATMSTPFNTGNSISSIDANFDGNYPYNGIPNGVYRKKTTSIQNFSPNRWGLYDMHGNVWEWCWDWYGNYQNETQTDPIGAASGLERVLRGGSWENGAVHLRSAYRFKQLPSEKNSKIGFRLVRR